MRVNDTLRQCRGSGAVDQIAFIVRCNRHRRDGRALPRDERLEFAPALTWRVAADEMMGTDRTQASQRIDPRALIPRGKHSDTGGIGAHGRDRRIVDRDIERHCDGTSADDAEHRQYSLETAVHQYRDALAGSKAERSETVCDTGRGRCELLPRQRDRAVDERRPVGQPAAVLRNQFRHDRRGYFEPRHVPHAGAPRVLRSDRPPSRNTCAADRSSRSG